MREKARDAPNMGATTMRFPPDLKRALDYRAFCVGLSQAEVVRLAVGWYLRETEGNVERR